MNRYWKQGIAVLAFAAAIGLWCFSSAIAKKPNDGGGGSQTTPQYNVIDLEPMWQAYGVTEPDESGTVWIAGWGIGDYYNVAMAAEVTAMGAIQVKPLPEPDKDVVLPNGSKFEGGSQAYAVNEMGDMVGEASIYDPDASPPVYRTMQGAFWERDGQGVFTHHRLHPLAGDKESSASDINDLGIAVGVSLAAVYDSETDGWSAVVWQDPVDGSAMDLNDLLPIGSGWTLTNASGINDVNQVCGVGDFQGARRAYRLDLMTGEIVVIPPLPGGTENGAFQLNFDGHVVGWSETGQLDDQGTPIKHGFLWKGEGHNPIDLGSLTPLLSYAEDINRHGAIVGESMVVDGFPNDWLALRWDNAAPPAVALDTEIPDRPSWHLRLASGLNDAGWIAGSGDKTVRGRTSRAGYILVPTGQ